MECKSGAKEHCRLSLKLADIIYKLQRQLSTEQDVDNRSELQTLLNNATTQLSQLDRQWSRIFEKHRSNYGSPCDCSLDSVDKNWFPL